MVILIYSSQHFAYFHPQARLSLEDINQFLDSLLKWVLETADTDLQRMSALRMVASILNKHVDGMFNYVLSNIPLSIVTFPELTSFLNNKLDVYWSERISGRSLATIQRIWAIKSWTWVISYDTIMLLNVNLLIRLRKHCSFASTPLL